MKQGIVTAGIQPIQAREVMKMLNKRVRGSDYQLELPEFKTSPVLEHTGMPTVKSINVNDDTLDRAGEIARKIVALQSKMPQTELSADLLTLSYALLHYENEGTK